MNMLSPHFSIDEMITSRTAVVRGIDNTPSAEIVAAMKYGCANVLEPVRQLLGHPMLISSGYRSSALNEAVGGSSKSQHMKGEAVDFICPQFGTPLEVCDEIIHSDIEFDQIIQEGTWVHLSWHRDAPRRSILTAVFTDRGVTYHAGLL